MRSSCVLTRLLRGLHDRGSYCSHRSTSDDLATDLPVFLPELLALTQNAQMGLIVQEYVSPLMTGHLSNERRVAQDLRDAEILATSAETGDMTECKIVHRNWRRAVHVGNEPLWCTTEDDIKKVLREPLALAAQETKRMHYEWVWDGQVVYVVQADPAPDEFDGAIPKDRLATAPVPSPSTELRRFVIATEDDSLNVAKLRSHMRYKTQGYWQPTFYILHDPRALAAIVAGDLPMDVEGDLRRLVAAPLMIRTGYSEKTVRLLPRSPILTTVTRAKEWLMHEFVQEIQSRGLRPEKVSLLAHHYIPALAAAFSFAAPDESDVLIESLWGVPEGLYYFPCDDYVVSTPTPFSPTADDFSGFAIRERIVFKSHFVEPEESGDFSRLRLQRPWDWKRTITSPETLCRMAQFTRGTAREEGHGVNIMWFLGCRTPGGKEEMIPWYQERQDELDHGSAFRRNARDETVTVSTLDDLESLRGRPGPPELGRLVLQLSPSEHIALRDDSFAREVGTEAARLDAIVVLRGARLTHIYYVLKKTGVQVVTKPMGDDTHVLATFTKLVRDKIPDRVAKGGESVTVARLSREQRLLALKVKLVEEAFEVRDAQQDAIVEELADVLEVLLALAGAAGVDPEEVEAVRVAKAESRGTFDEGLQLLETSFPADQPAPAPFLNEETTVRGKRLLRASRARPFEPVRIGGSDQRRGVVFQEYVNDLSVSLSRSSWKRALKADGFHGFIPDVATVLIDGRREGATLRLRIKLQFGRNNLSLRCQSTTRVVVVNRCLRVRFFTHTWSSFSLVTTV